MYCEETYRTNEYCTLKVNKQILSYLGCYIVGRNSPLIYQIMCDGDVNRLKWIHKNGYPWNNEECNYAAIAGSVECLQFAYLNGCRVNDITCSAAALGGNLECLRYLHMSECPWDKHTCSFAAFGGHVECLMYALDEGCLSDEDVCLFTVGNTPELSLEGFKYKLEHLRILKKSLIAPLRA